jgi:hypothetical protein
LQSKFFWFAPLGARNLHFLNRSEQNNQFKKCTQGASPKNSTLQRASQKKKELQREKTKFAHITGVSTYFSFFLMSLSNMYNIVHVNATKSSNFLLKCKSSNIKLFKIY